MEPILAKALEGTFPYNPLAKKRAASSTDADEKPTWEGYYERLRQFKVENGHCLVRLPTEPDADPEYVKFANWVKNQRYLLSKKMEDGELTQLLADRVARLNDLNFNWSGEAKYGEGLGYIEKNPRSAFTNFAHAAARNSDAIVGPTNHVKWETMFRKLCEFKEKHGHTTVTETQDKKLTDWVRNQKYFLGKKVNDEERPLSPITTDRVQRLDDIGFVWRKHAPKGKPQKLLGAVRSPARAAPVSLQNRQHGASLENALVGQVLGALDKMGALNNLGGGAGGDGKKPAALRDIQAALSGGAKAKKRVKLERKLEMVSQQLDDSEKNVVRFQGVNDDAMADQAKTRMVGLYHKKVEVEQAILAVEDEDEDELPPPQKTGGRKRRKVPTVPQKSEAVKKREKLDRKLEVITRQLAESEKNVTRFQGINDETMVEHAKARMALLYGQKVDIENDLMDVEEDDDDALVI
uniref:Helicase-associated domain-containing protein n=1 Tax=Entomoneis paludosa TaxID=265537 RepID=A0A6U2WQ64_9STRA